MDEKLVIGKLYSAISELSARGGDSFMVRPSNVGSCPLMLQWNREQAAAGVAPEPREGWRDWAALQGNVSEELMSSLLEAAGAEILSPPSDIEDWEESVPPDPDTGFKPHIDRLIRWPEVGLPSWTVLELKNLRAMGHIELFLSGLFYERQYWYQAVAYLKLASLAIQNYGAHSPDSEWGALARSGYKPGELVFFSSAKDPSTVRMMLAGRLKQTQKEIRTPERMTEEEKARAAWKTLIREKLELTFGGRIDFYMEHHTDSDPSVDDTWLDTINVVNQTKLPSTMAPAPALHDPSLPEDQLDVECRAYCPWLDRHRSEALREQLQQSVTSLEESEGQGIRWDN